MDVLEERAPRGFGRRCRESLMRRPVFAAIGLTLSSAIAAVPAPARIDVTQGIVRATPGKDADDDAKAINACLAALPASGGTLYFPAGGYLLKSRIVLRNRANVTFAGEGGTSVLRTPADTGKYRHGDFPLIEATASGGLAFRDLAFAGPGKAYGGDSVQSPAIYLREGSGQAQIVNCVFRDLNSGIRIENGSDCRVTGNLFLGAIVQDGVQLMRRSYRNVVSGNVFRYSDSARSGMGIRVSGYPNEPAMYNSISGNTISNAKDEGIVAEFAEGNTVSANTVSDCSYGIQLYDARNFTVTGNVVARCRRVGIGLFANSRGRRITGNVITGNSVRDCGSEPLSHAITVSSPPEGSADSNIISGNYVSGGNTNGIDITARFCLIQGNYVQASGKMGICLANAADCLVSGNYILQPGTHGIYGGTRSTISGNHIIAGTNPNADAAGLWEKGFENPNLAGNTIVGFRHDIVGAQPIRRDSTAPAVPPVPGLARMPLGAVEILSGAADPKGTDGAPVGSLYLKTDGTLFQKTAAQAWTRK